MTRHARQKMAMRFVSIMLCLVLLLGTVPANVFAAGETAVPEAVESVTEDDAAAAKGAAPEVNAPEEDAPEAAVPSEDAAVVPGEETAETAVPSPEEGTSAPETAVPSPQDVSAVGEEASPDLLQEAPADALADGDASAPAEGAGSGERDSSVRHAIYLKSAGPDPNDIVYFGSSVSDYDYVDRYGQTEPKWIVLYNNSTSSLLSLDLWKNPLTGSNSLWYNNTWQGSMAEEWCQGLYADSVFSSREKAALGTVFINSVGGSYYFTNPGETESHKYDVGVYTISNEYVVFPTFADAGVLDPEYAVAYYRGTAKKWSTCVPSAENDQMYMFSEEGKLISTSPGTNYYARPEISVRNNVGMVTQAEGGKASGPLGENCLLPIPEAVKPEGSSYYEWKVTLVDDSESTGYAGFTAQIAKDVRFYAGDTFEINYSGAKTGANQYVSVVLLDADGNLLNYGHLANNSAAGQNIPLKIPEDLEPGEYTVGVFAEEINGDKKTDFMSTMVELPLTIAESRVLNGILWGEYYQTNFRPFAGDAIYMGSVPDGYVYTNRDGSSDPKWVVLDPFANDYGGGIFVTSQDLWGNAEGPTPFAAAGNTNNWLQSDARAWCQDLQSKAFSDTEGKAALEITKSDSAGTFMGVAVGESSLEAERLFFLSAEDVSRCLGSDSEDEAHAAYYNGGNNSWWTRSPSSMYTNYVSVININQWHGVSTLNPDNEWVRMRPSMVISRSPADVLFVTAAEGGKVSGPVGTDCLRLIENNHSGEWKLTVNDSGSYEGSTTAGDGHPGFGAGVVGHAAALPGGTIRISYSGAVAGENEYVSVTLGDWNTKQYYGHIAKVDADSTSGVVDLRIPQEMTSGSYTLHIFAEQCNGDRRTDYVSHYATIVIRIVSTPPLNGRGTENDPYLIGSDADWKQIEYFLKTGGDTSGMYFRQTADIAVTTMTGTEAQPFQGHYDGGGFTLTFNFTASEKICAPFRYVDGAEIKNLTVDGTISTAYKFAGGIVGNSLTSCRLEDCISDVRIVSSVNGDGTHGGVVAVGSNVVQVHCAFFGSLIGPNTTSCGGLLGWDVGGSSCTDCLFDAQAFETKNNCGTIIRNTNNIENCYYTQGIGQGLDKGKPAHRITGAEYVSLGLSGTPGVLFRGVVYAAEGEEVTLIPEYSGALVPGKRALYAASAGTLTRSGDSDWILSVPAQDAVILVDGFEWGGDLRIDFSHSCSFGNNLAINYYILADEVPEGATIWLVGEKDVWDRFGNEKTVSSFEIRSYTTGTTDGVTEHKFVFAGIAAKEISDEVRVKLVAEFTADGKEYHCESDWDVYSALEYAVNRLNRTDNDSFKMMLVDLLYYADQAMTYFRYRETKYLFDDTTAEQRGMRSKYDITELDHPEPSVTPFSGTPKASFTGKTAVFSNSVALKYYFELAEGVQPADVRLHLTYTTVDGNTKTKNLKVTGAQYDSTYNEYALTYGDIAAKDMCQQVKAWFIDSSGKKVSDTIQYGLENYFFNRIADSDDGRFRLLLTRAIYYGRSAKAYFENK